MSSMSTSAETRTTQTSPRNCFDYSKEELRNMPDAQANKIISQRIQENGRVAREKAEARQKAKA